MSELLLEIASEEIPALLQQPAALFLFETYCSKLRKHFPNLELVGRPFATPRRIGFILDNMPSSIPESYEEIRGPRLTADQKAIEGFLKKYELQSIDQLEKKGGFYLHRRSEHSTDIADFIAKALEEVIAELTWPKTMRWGSYEMRWIRPVKSIICLLGDRVIPLRLGHIVASNRTCGHLFMSPQEITIPCAAQYEELLSKACVMIWPEQRKLLIKSALSERAAALGINLLQDQGLLDEVAGLVESPHVGIGLIDVRFAQLPREVLVTTLRTHQKYFMFEHSDGSIALFFGIVANILTQDNNAAILRNNQRVLNARLTDAEFFFESDKKHTLESRIEGLRKLSFHNKIGSVYDKVQSTKALAQGIARQLNTDLSKVSRSVELMKTDLLTEMVREFPELQGIMGYYYALYWKEDPEVALAIKQHYRPRGPNDALPEGNISIAVALADKLDTLSKLFAHGIKPTSTKDPFALRRAAIGIIRIQQENGFKLDLQQLGIAQDVIDFISEREMAIAS